MSWDDGKHAKVSSVKLTHDDVIRSIEVEYDGTNLKSQPRGTAGAKSDGFTLALDEYITELTGYYKTVFSGDVITALTFKTNKKTYGPYGNKTRHFFSVNAPSGNQIAGFLGTSGDSLNSIDVHFAPVPPPGSIKPKPDGPGTNTGDGGSKTDGSGTNAGDGGSKTDGSGTNTGDGGSKTDGSGTNTGDGGSKTDGSGTNTGDGGSKTDGSGTNTGDGGSKTDGSGTGTNTGDGGSQNGGAEKTGPVGGEKGDAFDDGVSDGVKKITVAADHNSITYIKIEYVKDGKSETREHGTNRGEVKEFTVNHPNEYIISVGGSYNHIFSDDTTLVTSLYFTLSNGRTSPKFGKTAGDEFLLEGNKKDAKLIGLHGRAGYAIDAIGAHFETSKKVGPVGGEKGVTFDDSGFDGIKKVTVAADEFSVTYIKIEYVKNGKSEIREHGTNRGESKEFTVNYPKENIIVVGGSYDHIFTYDTTLVTSLYFTLSNGRTSPKFGKTSGTDFHFKGENGEKVLGLHGRGGHAIDAIGAHFEMSSKTVEPGTNPGDSSSKPDGTGNTGPVGGDKGDTFDDIGFDGVRKVSVAADEYSVTYIKIEYAKNGKFETVEHGTNRGELKEFSVDYPKENIVAVGGSYDHIFTYDTTLVTSLYFTLSNGRTSPKFGKTSGTEFSFKGENGATLVGLHGRGGHAIDAIGAHFKTASVGPEKVEPQGGKGGNQWDDGADHDGVVKIHVAAGGLGIENIKFDYVKNGESKEGSLHGVKARAFPSTIVINHPNEYLVSVEGWFDSSNVIQGIQFKTNTKTSEYYGYEFGGDGTKFSLQVKDKKIIGFLGFAGSHLNSLGAYFAPI
ncbi:unnamed protein product [Microthlaspi erraticum]|uniref:Jacalin-type lectin domain-containing protein n=1 Tax=Microthlaspi erraticum TaxID=1685480 RepID=A0A6D2JJQ7_9BRAS|nr:unnamed protein product [Microthlaspi erraticum]